MGDLSYTLLKLLPKVDCVCVNFEEALQLADTPSGAKAIRLPASSMWTLSRSTTHLSSVIRRG